MAASKPRAAEIREHRASLNGADTVCACVGTGRPEVPSGVRGLCIWILPHTGLQQFF
jgi:hypothetical protein